ncbi:MAG: hypothetical protein JO219_05580 [Candidatus Eremiobacteraeota bacterium]|nr:hypothetical protein [Candidatus Eremiobacteraeota bacterium]
MKRFPLVLLIGLLLAAGCAKNPVISIPPPPPARLFVADLISGLVVFTQPITSTSTPSFTIPGAGDAGVVFDSHGNLYVSNENTATISVYSSPVSATSTPFMTIGPVAGASLLEGMAFDSSGNLFVADEGAVAVDEFTPPFTSGPQAPAKTITGMPFGPVNVVFDRAGDLITPSFGSSTVTVFRPPFANGANVPAATMTMPLPAGGSGIDLKDHLIVGQQNGTIAIVNPPFATGVTPSATIATTMINGATATEALNSTFDPSGNLWQTFGGDDGFPGQAGIAEFTPPLTGNSIATNTLFNGLGFPFSVAFGP